MDIKKYIAVTASYWSFTLTDGALRMLVLLYFHNIGYTPIQLSLLFMLYEFCGVITNITGGYLAKRFGLNKTLFTGIFLQIVALTLLFNLNNTWPQLYSLVYVIIAQGISGIAKDLTKVSAKSAIKTVVSDENKNRRLFKLVSFLTGSKNTLKGIGFFLGSFLLSLVGYKVTLSIFIFFLLLLLLFSFISLKNYSGIVKKKVKFSKLFSKSNSINILSVSRVFLFGARDIWFVVGIPIFFYEKLDWSFTEVGSFMASWIVFYGIVQSFAPKLLKMFYGDNFSENDQAFFWSIKLFLMMSCLGFLSHTYDYNSYLICIGLFIFAFVFAINSSIHSYLILALTKKSDVTLDVGFYYMANATGRLVGCLISGFSYQVAGLMGCLFFTSFFLFFCSLFSYFLKKN